MSSDTYSLAPALEVGAASSVELPQALSVTTPDNGLVNIKVYRRYSYSIGSSADTIHKVGPEYMVAISLLPSGTVYRASTETLDTAANIISDFRDWLLDQINGNELDTQTCAQYVALYAYTNNSTNPSFRHRLTALLSAAPANESSAEVDALIASVVSVLGYTQV